MKSEAAQALERVLAIMARLRDPEGGCPWDRQQSFQSIVPHTLEEAYEVAESIERGALEELPAELGDLLFQVVFYARLGEEAGLFDFETVARALAEKLVRRHPHVFGDDAGGAGEAREDHWEALKERERRAQAPEREPGVLEGVARALPALGRAAKLQRRAARAGFDWPDPAPVMDKVREELAELERELDDGGAIERREEEVGDLLFACVNLARHAGVEPEAALRRTNRKFERRFEHMEQRLREAGRKPGQCGLEELDALWEAAKRAGL